MTQNQFKPAWWLPNSHLQTIWPALCRRKIKLSLERERVELPDGDFIDLDWLKSNEQSDKLVLILHGLEGSIDSHYARGIMRKVVEQGWHGLFMHFRGCSGEPNRLPRGYHSGETNDLGQIVKLLLNRNPSAQIAVIGYSLGGNVLLKWLGETREQNPICAAIGISVPFELHKAAKHIQQGFAKFYQWYFIRCLRDRLMHKCKVVQHSWDTSTLSTIKTMLEFDDKITAPLHGFLDAVDYYQKSSSRQYLRHIAVPTLILHAKDDPFMTADVIPQHHEVSPKVILELSEAGGHVGFVAGRYPWCPEYWLETRIATFLKSRFL